MRSLEFKSVRSQKRSKFSRIITRCLLKRRPVPEKLASMREFSKKSQSALVPISTRSEEHTSELQSLMRISYAVFCLKKKKTQKQRHSKQQARSNKTTTEKNETI